jgi:hypothetical protein
MGWACKMHGEKKNVYEILAGKPKVNSPLWRLLGIDMTLIFKRILNKYGVRVFTGVN